MTKSDALAPVVALEVAVVTGRTYQAYKRGKVDEARERFIEETSGSVVWLGGVALFNKIGDKIVDKILKANGKSFDVGTDKVLRTPFDNFMNFMKKVNPNKFSEGQVAMIKGTKVLASVLLANYIIGFIVPKFNHALTKKFRHEKHQQEQQNKKDNLTFKGLGMSPINSFTYAIENTNTGKLLSTDFGVAGGRMYNARSKEERTEIGIRDIGSIYFYMWAQGHVRNLLNLAESGRANRLDPANAQLLTEQLTKFIGDKQMSAEEFKKAVLGSEVKIPENLTFETQELSRWGKLTKQKPLEVIKLTEAEKIITDPDLVARMREMAKLQPRKGEEYVITKQQIKDVYNKAEINDPKFLDKVFTDFTGGAHKEPYKFVSNKKLYNLKKLMEEYVEDICKKAKDGKIDKSVIEKAKKKNIMYNGINLAAGFAVAAAFLSTFIPKIQYWYTRKTTGMDVFPGTYDFKEHHEVED